MTSNRKDQSDGERGIALITALMISAILLALGMAVVMSATSDTVTTKSQRVGEQDAVDGARCADQDASDEERVVAEHDELASRLLQQLEAFLGPEITSDIRARGQLWIDAAHAVDAAASLSLPWLA